MLQVADIESVRVVSEATFAELLTPLIEPGFGLALALLGCEVACPRHQTNARNGTNCNLHP